MSISERNDKSRDAAPFYDEFLVLHFIGTNAPPYPFR